MFSNSDSNVALKCAWNDAGYKNLCKQCPNTNPSCSTKSVDVGLEDCWERHIFERWDFGVGNNKQICPEKTDKIVGKIAVFTTKKPLSDHRSVFAVARIKNVKKKVLYPPIGSYSAGFSDMIEFDPSLTVEIPNSIDVNFQDFDDRRWNQPLFRYLPDKLVRDILLKMKSEIQKANCNSQELPKLEQLIKNVTV